MSAFSAPYEIKVATSHGLALDNVLEINNANKDYDDDDQSVTWASSSPFEFVPERRCLFHKTLKLEQLPLLTEEG
jgi:hypothetical protein